jgi:UDP-galactopyranose mutase
MRMPSSDASSLFQSLGLPASARIPLVVFSHLRWGFVFQRPQHLLTRLARRFDVYFIEEPVFGEGEPRMQSVRQPSGVEVVTPVTPVPAPGFHDDQVSTLKALVAGFLADRHVREPLVWLYTPMALPLVGDLEARALVYDCMDELAAFKFAPPQLLERERALMQVADVVLTGGPSLYETRKDRHPNIHCLPSAVDSAHYAPANLDASSAQARLAADLHGAMPHPRLGFFGVIDERLDLGLVERLADLRPDWQVVMAGPVAKIDPEALPRRPNLHWVGMQGYDVLPHLVSQWDVCLLPFALNEHTRFISPTKTLEYLAGGKPAVSTPIHDVVSLYGTVVDIGERAQDFVAAIERTLARTEAEQARWRTAAQALVDRCTWDGTAARIAGLLEPYAGKGSSEPILLDAPLPEQAPLPVQRDGVRPAIMVPAQGGQGAQPLSL